VAKQATAFGLVTCPPRQRLNIALDRSNKAYCDIPAHVRIKGVR
jgi:hypothetical protein